MLKKIGMLVSGFLLSSLVSASAFALQVGDASPCVQVPLVDLSGAEATQCVNTSEQGNKSIMLEFFATTCSYCVENLPVVTTLAAETEDKMILRFVSLDRNPQAMRDFMQQKNLGFEYALDSKRATRSPYGILGTPTTVIVNPQGKVIYIHVGMLSQDDAQEIKALL